MQKIKDKILEVFNSIKEFVSQPLYFSYSKDQEEYFIGIDESNCSNYDIETIYGLIEDILSEYLFESITLLDLNNQCESDMFLSGELFHIILPSIKEDVQIESNEQNPATFEFSQNYSESEYEEYQLPLAA